HDFYQCWLRARKDGNAPPLQDFSPCAVMAESGRFFPPGEAQNTPIGGASYAYHVDASMVAAYLRRYSEARGVSAISGRVIRVNRNSEGQITQLDLEDGCQLHGDFFIDCTGFRALLIDKTLGSPFESWSHFLPCDR